MSEQRKRPRTLSVVKLSNQKKESKQRYEEAKSHIKTGNLDKGIFSFDKVNIVTLTFEEIILMSFNIYFLNCTMK